MRSSIKATLLACASLASLLSPFAAERPGAHRSKSAPSTVLSRQAPVSAEELPRGRVVEKVVVKGDASQSYALYLPSNYTTDKRWPVLYCFDPAARGSLPVELFRRAAERHGWIVVGSNNSRNGALALAWQATTAMWDDTRARLSIDERRIYAAGFSGGARSAIRLGHLCPNCLAGVVAAGAGFPVDIAPTPSLSFPLFLIAGTNDFNYAELKLLDGALDKYALPHRLEVFDGGHAWPSAEVCEAAVEWLELQAMRTGRRVRDETLVEELWRKASAKARAFEDAGKLYDAFLHYRALAADFKGWRDVAAFERRAAQLKETKEIRRATDEENGQIKRQQKLVGEIHALLEERRDANERALAMLDFRRMIGELKESSKETQDTGARRVARRTLQQLFAQVYEGASGLLRRGENYSLAASMLEAAAEIASDNPRIIYELACAYALNKEKRKALDALKRAVESGFDDAAELNGNGALDSLRGEAAFVELMEKLKSAR